MPEQFRAQQLTLCDSVAESNTQNTTLTELNRAGRQAFDQAAYPNRKTEAWKYTSLRHLNEGVFAAEASSHSAAGLDGTATIPALGSQRLVFVNGQLSKELSSNEALQNLTLFSQANDEQRALIDNHLDQIMTGQNRHLFNELNNAQLTDGVLLHIGKNVQQQQAIQVSWLTTQQATNFTVNCRLLVVVEQGADVTLVEHYASSEAEQNSFTNAVTEIAVGANARLQHYRLNMAQEDALHIGATHVDLARDAHYQSFHLGLGSKLTRNDVVVNHNEGGSHVEMSGVYVPQHRQLVDFHTCIEHKVPRCTTNEVFRGIMNDHAKAVFNGRIHIHADAQKTLAEMSNKNLLLTNEAEINTKPELEIYADDVQCAHGATVAQLEEKALFYMQSRGISKREAEVMLSFGFINELLEALPHEAIANYLRPILAHRFGREQSLTRHIV